ncbi:MAG TPA: hypothetical protein VGM28_02430 [Candidatus Limnocylindrales bacterium]
MAGRVAGAGEDRDPREHDVVAVDRHVAHAGRVDPLGHRVSRSRCGGPLRRLDVDRDARHAMVLAGVVGVEVAVRRRHDLLDPVTEGGERIREVALHGVVASVELRVSGPDPGVEQEQVPFGGPQQVGDHDALLAGILLILGEGERPGVERDDLPEPVVRHGPPGAVFGDQSSSGRKMCAAAQALQIGMAESRSPRGIGTLRSGYRHSTS